MGTNKLFYMFDPRVEIDKKSKKIIGRTFGKKTFPLT
jgi:hypothetical protein